MDTLRTSLGRRIRELRKSSKLTQEQLAECAGISTDFLSRVERGLCLPSLERIVTIAGYLDVCLAEFFLPIDPPRNGIDRSPGRDLARIFSHIERGTSERGDIAVLSKLVPEETSMN